MSAADEEITDSEMWRAQREESQQRRAAHRENAVKLLTEAKIEFVSKNNGAHLIVQHGRYDFWPGTGLWRRRNAKGKQRGVRRLIQDIRGART